MGKGTRTVEIPTLLYERLEKRVEETGFGSASEYVTFILERVLERLAKDEGEAPALTREDEEEVKERLRGLGYI